MYKIKQITDSIYHYEFKNKRDLFLAVMRMQEFYESPDRKIKGKRFSLEDLISSYCEMDEDDEFKYFTEFSAFNIPGSSIKEFIETMGINLMQREKIVLSDIKKTLEYNEKQPPPETYYIFTYKNKNHDAEKDFRHELGHAMFHITKMYKRVTIALLDNSKLFERMRKRLKEMKYDDSVLEDEAICYLATSSLPELKQLGFSGLNESDTTPFRKAFKSFNTTVKPKRKGIRRILINENNRTSERQQTI